MTCDQGTVYLTEAHVRALLEMLQSPTCSLVLLGSQGDTLLRSALGQPQQTYAGADLYPSLASKAAILLFCLVRNHPFQDGNKRFGTSAMDAFLDLNGYVLDVSDDDLVSWVERIASPDAPTVAEIEQWIASRMRRIV